MTDFSQAVYRGVESDVLDYKAAMNWNNLPRRQRAKFIRHCLAFANTKGGMIVVGVGEDASGHPSLYTGLTPEQLHSFDPSPVGNFINSFVDPQIDFTIERPEIDGKRYAIFVIQPFRDLPHVCTNSVEDELQVGCFYIRTASASSRAAYRAGELHSLIRRALSNQRALLGQMLREILNEGLCAPQPGDDRTDAEREEALRYEDSHKESMGYFSRRLNLQFSPKVPIFDLAVMPLHFDPGALSLTQLRKCAGDAVQQLAAQNDFLTGTQFQKSYFTNVSLRGMSEKRDRFWQFYLNGLLHFALPLVQFHQELLEPLCKVVLRFAQLYFSRLPVARKADRFQIVLLMSNCQNAELRRQKDHSLLGVCRIPEIHIELDVTAAEWQKNPQQIGNRLWRELCERFNLTLNWNE